VNDVFVWHWTYSGKAALLDSDGEIADLKVVVRQSSSRLYIVHLINSDLAVASDVDNEFVGHIVELDVRGKVIPIDQFC